MRALLWRRMTIHKRIVRMTPGSPTTANTPRHDVRPSSHVARMGPSPSPNRANMLCWRPWLNPMRAGFDASAVAAKLTGQKAPSATPINPRIKSRLVKPPARPLNAEASEKTRSAGSMTLRRPIRSERLPRATAATPQVVPRIAIRTLMSGRLIPRSRMMLGASGAMIQRSRPTRPNPRLSSTTAFHS